MYLTLDWLRVVANDGNRQALRDYLTRKLGEPEPREGGMYFCKAGETYPGGAKLLWHHPFPICIVDFPGSSLSGMSAEARVGLARDLQRMGCHASRLDLAGDFVGQGLGLYEAASASCKAGELCGARVFNHVESKTDTEWKGRTLYLGLRGGNGSGRYVRLYDKGLETQSLPVGEWERYEVEFTDKSAQEAFMWLCNSGDQWGEMHKGLMLGAVEFRQATGDKHKARRPLAEWWAAMIAAVKCVRSCADRPLVEWARWKKWAGKCVVPTLEGLSRKLAIPFDVLLLHLSDATRPPKQAKHGGIIEQAAEWWSALSTLHAPQPYQ